MATVCIAGEALPLLLDRLDAIGADEVGTVLAAVADEPTGQAELARHREGIDRCFSADDMNQIMRRLEAEGSQWADQTRATLEALSPTSLSVTLALLRHNRGLSLPACLEIELRLTRAMTRGHDFLEGVRAVVVDKDKKPRWAARGWSRSTFLPVVDAPQVSRP